MSSSSSSSSASSASLDEPLLVLSSGGFIQALKGGHQSIRFVTKYEEEAKVQQRTKAKFTQNQLLTAAQLLATVKPVNLKFCYNQFGRKGILVLKQGLFCGNLTSLELRDQNLGDGGAAVVMKAVAENTVLESLFLYSNNIGDHGGTFIAAALKVNETLTSLFLSDNHIGEQGGSSIGESFMSNNTLTRLSMSDNNIEDLGGVAFAESLKVNSALTELNLSNNNIGQTGGIKLGEALQVNTVLTTINLRTNTIGPQGAISIGQALATNNSLTTLCLSSNAIGSQGASVIAVALEANHALTSLDLWNNKIGDQGCIAIANTLKVNSVLSSINMDSNGIGEQGFEAIAEALKVNASLHKLELTPANGSQNIRLLLDALKFHNVSLGSMGGMVKGLLKPFLSVESRINRLSTVLHHKMCNNVDISSVWKYATRVLHVDAMEIWQQVQVLVESSQQELSKSIEVPEKFCCPVTHQIMVNPCFLLIEGDMTHSYEREVILEWLETHDTDPSTNSKVDSKTPIANRPLRNEIAEFLQENPDVTISGEMYLSKTLQNEMVKAILEDDVSAVISLCERDARLWNQCLDFNQVSDDSTEAQDDPKQSNNNSTEIRQLVNADRTLVDWCMIAGGPQVVSWIIDRCHGESKDAWHCIDSLVRRVSNSRYRSSLIGALANPNFSVDELVAIFDVLDPVGISLIPNMYTDNDHVQLSQAAREYLWLQCLENNETLVDLLIHLDDSSILYSKSIESSSQTQTSVHGDSCFHVLVRHNHLELASSLLEQLSSSICSDVLDCRNDDGHTVLGMAVQDNNLEAVELLLRFGSDLMIPFSLGETTTIMEQVVAIGNNDVLASCVKNLQWKRMLTLAVTSESKSCTDGTITRLIRSCLQIDADKLMETVCAMGLAEEEITCNDATKTAVWLSCSNGDIDVMTALISIDPIGLLEFEDAMFCLVIHNHSSCLEKAMLLIGKDRVTSMRNADGKSLLQVVVESNHAKSLETLLSVVSSDELDQEMIGQDNGSSVLEYILRAGLECRDLMIACLNGGRNVNQLTAGKHPLRIVAEANDQDSFDVLMEHGAVLEESIEQRMARWASEKVIMDRVNRELAGLRELIRKGNE